MGTGEEMSAQPGRIDVCKDCDYQDTVCPNDCQIYQDLKAEEKEERYVNRYGMS